jgi:hypothetical protein
MGLTQGYIYNESLFVALSSTESRTKRMGFQRNLIIEEEL